MEGLGQGSCLDKALEGVRRAMERTTQTADLLLLYSLAGGSGSGLGSRILENLRKNYPRAFIMNVAVAPRPDGDTPLQNYNSVMAAQWMQAYSDGILLFQNADLLQSLERLASSRRAAPASTGGSTSAPPARISFAEVNRYIAASLSNTLRPHTQVNRYIAASLSNTLLPFPPPGRSAAAAPNTRAARIRDVVATVCPDPAMKFLELRSAPIPFHSAQVGARARGAPPWTALAAELSAMVPRHDALDGGRVITSTAAMATLRAAGADGDSRAKCSSAESGAPAGMSARGASVPGASSTEQHAGEEAVHALQRTGVYPSVRWQREQWRYRAHSAPVPGRAAARALTVVANRSNVIGPLNTYASRAAAMLEVGAFVHWYERYDVPKMALWDAMEATQDIVDCYRYCHGHSRLA
ncbi:hypothetical protein CYMTET_21226 [Cymbomonas tetramitiformis]|uniref:Tubulin/FtsZ GTPase domain-containing protein n=1 Tax=Cymbomonas tetramitiformis TaxID=36881 RepID=A0AAE0G390_9CHLO|nr:hypothetical protein CYMTET_21226 [Cymbomonas tetramitiformis]